MELHPCLVGLTLHVTRDAVVCLAYSLYEQPDGPVSTGAEIATVQPFWCNRRTGCFLGGRLSTVVALLRVTQIQIMGLCEHLDTPVKIEYLDGQDFEGRLGSITLPDTGAEPMVTLLYRCANRSE